MASPPHVEPTHEEGIVTELTPELRAALTAGRLGHIYLGPDVTFPPFDDPPPGHVIHIRIDRVGGVGPWTPAGA